MPIENDCPGKKEIISILILNTTTMIEMIIISNKNLWIFLIFLTVVSSRIPIQKIPIVVKPVANNRLIFNVGIIDSRNKCQINKMNIKKCDENYKAGLFV